MPAVLTDNELFSLTDMCKSEFRMAITDSDFSLTHEELIKVCKILLYKFNLSAKKVAFERRSLAKLIDERMHAVEQAA